LLTWKERRKEREKKELKQKDTAVKCRSEKIMIRWEFILTTLTVLN
jgi:hypothetical protein